jgi:hypothetical protein
VTSMCLMCLCGSKNSLLHNHNCIHHVPDMRKRYLDVGNIYFCYKIFGFSVEDDQRLSQLIVGNFHFVELQSITPAGADGFQKSFFGSKTRCIMLGFVFLGFAVSDFSGVNSFSFSPEFFSSCFSMRSTSIMSVPIPKIKALKILGRKIGKSLISGYIAPNFFPTFVNFSIANSMFSFECAALI